MNATDQDTAIYACRPNLLVGDLSTSLRFYRDVLGFQIGWHWSDRRNTFLQGNDHGQPGEPGTALIQRERAHIILTQVAGDHTTWLHIDVNTPAQVDELFDEWTGRGAAIGEPPTLRAWGMYEMRVPDPDGNVLRVSAHPS